ncbi:phosphatase PAP2 family protein [Kytococcus sp. Marseille-QA3725]
MPPLHPLLRLPVLAVLSSVLTVASMGPLQRVDLALHGANGTTQELRQVELLQLLDSIAGQDVVLPVLGLVALWAAVVGRSLQPLLLATWATFLFYAGVGGLKVLLARSSPTLGDPSFFSGGLLTDGWYGISYPSGHTSAAVLLYGTAVLLVQRAVGLPRWAGSILVATWAGLVVMVTAVAQLLGYHWVCDLAGGIVVGGVLLHLVLRMERWTHEVAPRMARTAPTAPAAGRPALSSAARRRPTAPWSPGRSPSSACARCRPHGG